jgi:SAM-dependent methyltransferase
MNAETPRFSDSQISEHAAETISGYDETAARFAARWGELRLERALHAFASRIPGRRQVLELGCGPGRDVDFLSQLGCQVVGLDLSAGMLTQARERLPDACLVRADLCRLPFARGSFDGIWACASLLHLPRAHFPTVLGEIAWLLHPARGVLYLALKGGQGERWVVDGDGRRYFFAYYQPSDIETALGDAGFQVVEWWVASDESGRAEPWLNFVARLEAD